MAEATITLEDDVVHVRGSGFTEVRELRVLMQQQGASGVRHSTHRARVTEETFICLHCDEDFTRPPSSRPKALRCPACRSTEMRTDETVIPGRCDWEERCAFSDGSVAVRLVSLDEQQEFASEVFNRG